MLIGDADVRPPGADEAHAVDPVSGERLEPGYPQGGAAEVERAAELAHAAFDTYRATAPEARARFLESIAANIDALGAALVERVMAETGLPEQRVLGERARTTGQLRLFAAVVRAGGWLGVRVDPADPGRTPLPRPDLRQRKIPLGPVAVFAASNFPLAFSVAGGDTASALAAGAPVVVKAHNAHPGTSELVGRAVRAAVREHGLPEGTFSLLFGPGPGLGTALVQDPRIAAVGFTGSRSGGLALAAAAAARPVPIPVYAEMSSVNPVVLLPGALAERGPALGAAYVASLTTGAGQLCTSPGLVFAVGDADGFLAAAADAVAAAPAAPMLTDGIRRAYDEGAARLAGRPGVTELATGARDAAIASCGQARLYVTDGATFRSDESLQAEVFGATSLVVRVRDLAELHAILGTLEGQLTATVHAAESDHPAARQLLPRLEVLAGRVLFGGWPTGVEVGHAVVHGGPFPATSAPATTSVGTLAIERFLRPVSYQDVPEALLPAELRDGNPAGVPRLVDGVQETGGR
ncbi:aldehyde dehydrogenase (NADP(+)) [Marinitenerispora sediminis]|uniref:2,5-dioxovalerate dehydrogenase n=1 Tax=Marinitenerispora sediminis TaxID=1931232 RepID=A0A368T8V4_9ACTN|nr:aldehyde dehydrogenase (NADP(+)) [Marinitenerispora sediminis]RCV51876.1 aldehyde dehydrogenase (NADP(+)) [Marinitenerispora sediminis]RCV54827.1 aldehyde dehydrogenase (NADP(+)) [Marinitenerispora sediminis]RCV58949.1 aldehyde dehydrogenase (NADP(+)) [Marinitenerispora sediminis]